jgi:hypothetical protein
VFAVVMMAASLSIIVFYVASGWVLPTVVGLIMAAAGAYVVTRRGGHADQAPVHPSAAKRMIHRFSVCSSDPINAINEPADYTSVIRPSFSRHSPVIQEPALRRCAHMPCR